MAPAQFLGYLLFFGVIVFIALATMRDTIKKNLPREIDKTAPSVEELNKMFTFEKEKQI